MFRRAIKLNASVGAEDILDLICVTLLCAKQIAHLAVICSCFPNNWAARDKRCKVRQKFVDGFQFKGTVPDNLPPVSYTHLRAHETRHDLVCRLLLEKKKK